MGSLTTVVDSASPALVAAAIQRVQLKPELRSEHGLKALWIICKSPGHQIARHELNQQIGALDLHFGWFCRRVAEELGDKNPDALALVDYKTDNHGNQILAVKPNVLAAMPRAAREAPKPD